MLTVETYESTDQKDFSKFKFGLPRKRFFNILNTFFPACMFIWIYKYVPVYMFIPYTCVCVCACVWYVFTCWPMNCVGNAHSVFKLNHGFLLRGKQILYCKSFQSVLEPRIAYNPLPQFNILTETCTSYSDFQRTVETYNHPSHWSNISLCFAHFYLLFTGRNFHCEAIFAKRWFFSQPPSQYPKREKHTKTLYAMPHLARV